MKIHLLIPRMAAGCAVAMAFSPRAGAAIADTDFEALKNLVVSQGEKIQALETTNNIDRQQIDQLQQQLGRTQATADSAQQKADAIGQVQSTYPAANLNTSATHNFSMVGDAEVQFGKTAGQDSTFALADFAPIFLYRANDNVLFEAGFDIMLNNNTDSSGNRAPGSSTAVELSFAQLDYLYNDYLTIVAGDMVLPLGTYSERAAGWLNKVPTDPLIRDWLPGSGIGVQLRGAAPIGSDGQSITYSFYGVNGPSSGSATSTANAADLDLGGNVGDTPNWHADPSAGGRIGWFYPWKVHYDLELGISGQSGPWSDTGNRLWSAGVVDAALHLSPFFEAKGEYIRTWVDTDDLGTIRPRGWWGQASYKLAGLKRDMPLINNLELVGRYDHENDAQGTKTDRETVGYVYYITNTLLFEGDYEFLHSRGPNALPSRDFVFQLSYGF